MCAPFYDSFEDKKVSRNYWQATGDLQPEFMNGELRLRFGNPGKSGALRSKQQVSGGFVQGFRVKSFDLLEASSGNAVLGLEFRGANETIQVRYRKNANGNSQVITKRIKTTNVASPMPTPTSSPAPSGTPSPSPAPIRGIKKDAQLKTLQEIGFDQINPEEFDLRGGGPVEFEIAMERNSQNFVTIYFISFDGSSYAPLAQFQDVQGPGSVFTTFHTSDNFTSGRARVFLHDWNVFCAAPTPSPSPTPGLCNQACDTTSECSGGLSCINGMCRNSACGGDNDCVCGMQTPTPYPQTPSPTAQPSTPTPSPWPSSTPSPTPLPWTPSPSPAPRFRFF